jgi:hypothetical protein
VEEPPAVAVPSARLRRMWLTLAAALVVFLLWLIGLGGYPVITWSRLNCTAEEIDLRTGRVRTTHYLLWQRVRERVEDSALTSVLSPIDLEDAEAEWQLVNTFSPCVSHSPHHAFHGAISETRMIALAWSCGRFSSEAKRLMAKDVLAVWKEGGSVHASDKFTRRIEELIDSVAGREITAKDVLGAWRAAETERGASR